MAEQKNCKQCKKEFSVTDAVFERSKNLKTTKEFYGK